METEMPFLRARKDDHMMDVTGNDQVRFRSACDGGGACVEVGTKELVAVRDSRSPDGPVLLFTRGEWLEFVRGVQAGVFDIQ
jgi:hypothetical protein